MGAIQNILEAAAKRREASDLGGVATFVTGDPIPCSMGADMTSLQRAVNTDGFQIEQTRKIVVRTSLLSALPRFPQSGDTVILKGNLENKPATLQISDTGGVESLNGILTVISVYNPEV